VARSSRIAIGVFLSTAIWFTPAAAPHFIEVVFSTAAAARVWETLCLIGFWSGGWIAGTAWTKGRVERGRVFLEDEVTGLIAPRDTAIQQLNEANSQWERAFQTVIAERDELKNRYLQALADSDNIRKRYRTQMEETTRLVNGDRDRIAAENAELKRSLARMCALPENIMCILKSVVALPIVENAVRVGLHPDRAKGGDPRERERQRVLREKMFNRFLELIDYLRKH
jgi:hypothetical protein